MSISLHVCKDKTWCEPQTDRWTSTIHVHVMKLMDISWHFTPSKQYVNKIYKYIAKKSSTNYCTHFIGILVWSVCTHVTQGSTATWTWWRRPGAARRCGWWSSPASAASSRWRAAARGTGRWWRRCRRRSSAAPIGCAAWCASCAPRRSSARGRAACTWRPGGSSGTWRPSGSPRRSGSRRPATPAAPATRWRSGRRRRRCRRGWRTGRCSPSSGRPCSRSTSAAGPPWRSCELAIDGWEVEKIVLILNFLFFFWYVHAWFWPCFDFWRTRHGAARLWNCEDYVMMRIYSLAILVNILYWRNLIGKKEERQCIFFPVELIKEERPFPSIILLWKLYEY